MIIGTPHDFAADGYAYRNYIADPQEWYNLFKISWQGPPGIYRLVVPLRPDEPPPPYPPPHAGEGREGAALATAQRKLQRFNPRAASYEIVFYDSYTVAQRVPATFRKGHRLGIVETNLIPPSTRIDNARPHLFTPLSTPSPRRPASGPPPPPQGGGGRGGAALATAQRKLQRFNPRAASYEIVFYDSYTVAQRVAATFRKGHRIGIVEHNLIARSTRI